jgi:hypothetical protein
MDVRRCQIWDREEEGGANRVMRYSDPARTIHDNALSGQLYFSQDATSSVVSS